MTTQASHTPQTKVTPWKLKSSSKALDEKWFPVRKDTVELPNGKIIDDYFVWESPEIAMAIPVTAEGKFVIVRQYRHAAGKVLPQFPAGAVDKDETVEEAALRELVEETGYMCQKLTPLGVINPYATKMTGRLHIYLAEEATFQQAPKYDPQEESEVLLLTRTEVLALLDSQELTMACYASAILLAFRKLGLPLN